MKRWLMATGIGLGIVLAVSAASAQRIGERVEVSEFKAALGEIRALLLQGAIRPMSAREWKTWDQASAEINALLEGKTSVDELDQDERVALFNAQERLNAVLSGDEDARVECRRVRRTGSNLRTGVCATVAELREQREAGQAAIRRVPQEPIRPGTG